MKRNIRIGLVAVLPFAVLVGIGTAFARGMHRHDPAHMKQFVDTRANATLDDLKATDAQRQQIMALVDGFVDKVQAEHVKGEHHQMMDAVAAAIESGDSTAVDQLIDQHATERTALAHDAVTVGKNIQALLTPDQRTQLVAKIRSHQFHGGRGGPGGGGGGF